MAKILLIEDEQDQSKMIKIRLESRGYQVITACKAEEGIKLALENKPDLILMDMVLPGMNGLEATTRLKRIQETQEIPVIALSAMNLPDFKDVCLEEGICAFISKPYEPAELFYEIEKNIRKKHQISDKIKGFVKIEKKILSNQSKLKIKSEERNITGKNKRRETTKKILIVDDNQELTKMLSIKLKASGYQVMIASDAVGAVMKAHRQRPDLILLDIMMPAGGGEMVFKNLKISSHTMLIPVIFISGLLSPEDLEEKANQMGADACFHKPFESEQLIARIKEILGQ